MKLPIIALSTAALYLLSVPPLHSDDTTCTQSLKATFSESAPRDNFNFTNLSNDMWQVKSISIDLAKSSGKLIFDTQEGGDGVEVFQRYKTESDSAILADVTQPNDGTSQMKLEFAEFNNQQSFRFSIDVDDTLTNSSLGQIRVTGGELNGAELEVVFASTDQSVTDVITLNGTYDSSNSGHVSSGDCKS